MNYTISKSTGEGRLRADTIFYQIGKFVWIPLLAIGFWFAGGGYEEYGEFLACALRKMSGLPCPGCGGTRAFYYLFQGKFRKSFQYHPAVLYGIGAYIHFMGLYFYRMHIAHTIERKEIQIPYYMYAAIAVILLQWIYKVIKILSFL